MRIVRRSISELSSNEVDEITSFLDRNFCTIFHELPFNQIAAENLGTEFQYSMVRDAEGELVALCPLHSIKSGIIKKTYSNPAIYDIRYGGWIYDEQKTCIPELMNLSNLNWKESLTYWSSPQISRDEYANIDHKIQFHTPIVDLALPLDEILQKSVTRKRRQTIASALRKGVVVEELSLSNLHVFLEQCAYLKRSIGFSPLPADFLIHLYRYFNERKKAAVFATKYNDDYLASGMILGNSKMMHLWVAGRPKEIRTNLPRQDLLVWESIKWAKQNECRYFDLCYVDERRQREIAVHKLGFTKNIVPFYCITQKRIGYKVLSKLSKIL